MSETSSITGSQGSATPVASLAVMQATTPINPAKGTAPVAPSETKAAQEATEASEAASLELSKSSASSLPGQKLPNAVMTMEEAAEAFQNYLSNLPSNLQFQPDYQAGLLIFKVINPVTQKVIRQLPPEEVVKQARYLRNAAKEDHSGILLDSSL